jgi:hypothetical protein
MDGIRFTSEEFFCQDHRRTSNPRETNISRNNARTGIVLIVGLETYVLHKHSPDEQTKQTNKQDRNKQQQGKENTPIKEDNKRNVIGNSCLQKHKFVFKKIMCYIYVAQGSNGPFLYFKMMYIARGSR